MIRIQIKKNNVVTHQADFSTQELADAWVLDNVANNSWGKPERWLTELEAQTEGLDILNALESQVIDEVTSYKFAAEYLIEQSDVSAEYQEALDIQQSKEAVELGSNLISKIAMINRRKLKSHEWDDATFNSLMVNSTVANAERALWNGSLKTAKALILSLVGFYTPEEKASIVADIDAHIAKWP